jgi:hypothetical protein
MNEKEKELLFKDLCTRLPYGVKVHACYEPTGEWFDAELIGLDYTNKDVDYSVQYTDSKCPYAGSTTKIKPYLRSMSSMTEEECIELSHLFPSETDVWKYIKTPVPLHIANPEQFDFFHKKHLDWRGLIPKGLALEAPNGMYA